MKNAQFCLLLFVVLSGLIPAQAVTLSSYRPFDYQLIFTNPECRLYRYENYVSSQNGERLSAKPKNAYCHPGSSKNTISGGPSPRDQIVSWVEDQATREIFMAYLSFSESAVERALCQKLSQGLKLVLVLDSNNEDEPDRMRAVNALKRCGGDFTLHMRGNQQGNGPTLGYAHNKVMIINPDDTRTAKILFSSGNLSSGTTTHHENWHFITTSPESYFAKIHQCLRIGMIEHGESFNSYKNFINRCRGQIRTEEEKDIQVFLVPGDGQKALQAISYALNGAESFSMTAHRFSFGALNNMLERAMNNGKQGRLIADDDMYWAGKLRRAVGRNTTGEAQMVQELVRQDLDVRYMQTYLDDLENPVRMQLQHNKFMLFSNSRGGSVFTGAGNFTSSAFNSNFENFYMISIPQVVRAFEDQYQYLWKLATEAKDLPSEFLNP